MTTKPELDAIAQGLPPGIRYEVKPVIRPEDGTLVRCLAGVGSASGGYVFERGATETEALQGAVDAFWVEWNKGEMRPTEPR